MEKPLPEVPQQPTFNILEVTEPLQESSLILTTKSPVVHVIHLINTAQVFH